MELSKKHCVVLGIGSSGTCAAKLLARHGALVTIRDSGTAPGLAKPAEVLQKWAASNHFPSFQIELGAEVQSSAGFELAVISPGIDPSVEMVSTLKQANVPIIGELELAYRFCKSPIVAITGTNGKTTTTELVTHVLKAGGKRVETGGNIGRPLSDLVAQSESLDALVVEVSSFQLEHIADFRPHVSIHLNLTPDHLDRYPNMEAYRDAKWNMFRNQTEDDIAIINETVVIPNDVPNTSFPKVEACIIRFSVGDLNSKAAYRAIDNQLMADRSLVLNQGETRLIGPHNAENILAAIAVADFFGIERDATIQALKDYSPLPHRCEVVRRLDAVTYINDSKATNIDALEKALMAIETPIVLIAGGKDKGLEFDHLNPLMAKKVTAAVLIGNMTQKLTETWQGIVACYPASSLSHAVDLARSLAKPNQTVLLSPGCSSFDMFKNYEDRGNQFRQLVLNLPTNLTPTQNPTNQADS